MTVAELIEKLKGFDPNAPVEMVDADTGWRIPTIHVTEGSNEIMGSEPVAGTIYLWCDYSEMPAGRA